MGSAVLPTFEVDKAGMAKVFARKGKAFIVTELLQNAWDEDTTHVDVSLEQTGGGVVKLTVEDDNPDGFADLKHAYTLFAESAKKIDPTKRGRFNLGEKLVIAMCDTAAVETTKGTVLFDKSGRRMLSKKRGAGSRFVGTLRMKQADVDDVVAVVSTLIPPSHISTTFNFNDVLPRKPLVTFEATLRTEIADDEGRLKPTTRKTTVEVHEPRPGERATLYEMGIPVVETDDRYHVNVMQKVPLNTDRDNVTPAYLRDVRTMVLNHAYPLIEKEAMQEKWVTEALEDEKVEAAAVEAVMTARYGEKRVIMDPTDPEANRIAMSEGYSVVSGGSLPRAAWANVKASGALLPAGQVTPSPDPSEGAERLNVMDQAHWPEAVEQVVAFSQDLAMRLMGVKLTVRIAQDSSWGFDATYGPSHASAATMTLNYGRLGHKWFAGPLTPILDLLFDEFGHHYSDNHLDRAYYKALRMLGAKCVTLALEEPAVFGFRRATVLA